MGICRIPLEHAGLRETMARVAYRLIQRQVRKAAGTGCSPSMYQTVSDLVDLLRFEGFGGLAVSVALFLPGIATRTQPKDILAAMVGDYRRSSENWRRREYPQYKANRVTPPVSNTGGHLGRDWTESLPPTLRSIEEIMEGTDDHR